MNKQLFDECLVFITHVKQLLKHNYYLLKLLTHAVKKVLWVRKLFFSNIVDPLFNVHRPKKEK